MIFKKPTGSRLTSYLAVPAVALGLALGSAAVAGAEPISENTIKSECKAAGGTYGTTAPSGPKGRGSRLSTCTFKDINGETSTDNYYDGHWTGTTSGPPK
ncbi:hypothetical protein H7I41_26285 [Mycobacterium manitobense]|uniref:DUF3761 domain-containing protein n=1 Tax=[Mycobacterium] manitobense TaxID=190147 RepID=A0A9X2YUG6_9MYCO|nr:hypothetical protein [[Mycobacterium] manitobense]MCV7173436.1 hypothetical protein [[Mycobacterium] manitobense]